MFSKGQLINIAPRTQREEQICKIFGNDSWEVLEVGKVLCFNNQLGVLVTKKNHMRWIKIEQCNNI